MFHSQTQRLEPPYKTLSPLLGGKTVIEVLRRDLLCLRLTGSFYEMLVILF